MGGLLLHAGERMLTAAPGEPSPQARRGLPGVGKMCVLQAWLAGAGRFIVAGACLAGSLLPAVIDCRLAQAWAGRHAYLQGRLGRWLLL